MREACLRELRRGGQIYFVHNSVETIDTHGGSGWRELVPEARVAIGHGQMRERELEQVMLDFYHRAHNLLVCTTIIESGIDVPTANTIIIDRADRFGLAQLHQLRGRVGRSHHQAYAYLIAPPREAMTADAAKRLEAIESLEDLGAGFVLATHDLEIRGAGELLGEGQSGQIHEIGFALYLELLERAVAALRAGRVPELEKPLHHGPEVDLHVPALLPETYLPDVHARLVLYKRISGVESEIELDDLQSETIDRFGPCRRCEKPVPYRADACDRGATRHRAARCRRRRRHRYVRRNDQRRRRRADSGRPAQRAHDALRRTAQAALQWQVRDGRRAVRRGRADARAALELHSPRAGPGRACQRQSSDTP